MRFSQPPKLKWLTKYLRIIDLSGDIPKQTIYYNRGIPNKF